MQKPINDSSTIVRGLLLPSEWLSDGTVTVLCIHTQEEEVISIEMTSNKSLLMKHLRCEVVAIGKIKIDTKGRKTITITSFSVLP